MAKVLLGSRSHGTLRMQDLLPMVWEVAQEMREGPNGSAPNPYTEGIEGFLERAEEDPNLFEKEEADNFHRELCDEINANIEQPFVYFGSHPGDGSDFGFWFDFDAFDDSVQNGETLKVRDLSEITDDQMNFGSYEYFAVVNDHGNVTVYHKKIELEEVTAVV